MRKNVNTIFYEFQYSLKDTIEDFDSFMNQTLINTSLSNLWNTKIEMNGITYSVVSIQNIMTNDFLSSKLKGNNNIFFCRIARTSTKCVYSTDLDYTTFDDEQVHPWEEIKLKEWNEFLEKDCYFVFKLNNNKMDNSLSWIISSPRLNNFIWKETLKNIFKEILDKFFVNFKDDSLNIANYNLNQIYKEIDLNTLEWKIEYISFKQRYPIDEKYKELLWEETDELEKKVVIINQSSISKFLKLYIYLMENKIEDKNYLIDDVKIYSKNWVYIFWKGFETIKNLSLKFEDWSLDIESKKVYIEEISNEILDF